jgi:hypothetical protein
MTTTEHSYAATPELTDGLKKYQNMSAFMALLGLGALVAGYFIGGPTQFLRSYLTGFYMWFAAGAGCLGLLMTQYLSGGAWGVMVRRPLEAGAKTLYAFWLGFLPLILGSKYIYWWTTAAGQADKRIQEKALYLNLSFLVIRWLIYGVVWLGLTYLLTKWSKLEDETKSMDYSKRLEWLSAPGVVALFFTMTFVSVDYLMTLEPHWYSTIYGFLTIIGGGLTALCTVVAGLILVSYTPPFNHMLTKKHTHDLGKLMLAFLMLWAYLNFSQLLITWSANLPDEVVWYIKRWNGGWGTVATFLWVFHFFVPFGLLLSQQFKKNKSSLLKIAIFIIIVRAVDYMFLVEPNFVDVKNVQINLSWMDFAAPIGFGGLWLALFFWFLPQRNLLPIGAPDFLKGLNHGRDH